MPTISMFYSIIICLYFYDDERHKLPHIHAKYQGQEAAGAFGCMRFLIDVQLPRRFVIWLAGAGHDALHTLDLPLKNRTPDNEIVARAMQDGGGVHNERQPANTLRSCRRVV